MEWVQRNRSRATRTVSIGACVERLVESSAAGLGASRELLSLIDALVDAEFRECCEVATVPGGGIVIRADHPVVLAAMRAKWSSRIRHALRRAGLKPPPGQIRFELR